LRQGETAKTLGMLPRITLDGADLRQFLAISLAHIEDVGSAKADDGGGGFRQLFVVLRSPANDRSQNHNALFTLLHEAAKLVPGAEACDVAGIGLLRSDEQDIVKAVAVKVPDGFEITREGLTVSGVQCSDELLRGSFRDFLDLF